MDNGGCDGQCTNRPGGYFCSCSTGFRLASNGKKCIGLFRSHFLSLGFPFVPVRVLSFNTMVLFSFLVNEGKSVSQRFSSCFQLQRFEAQLIKDNSATVFFSFKKTTTSARCATATDLARVHAEIRMVRTSAAAWPWSALNWPPMATRARTLTSAPPTETTSAVRIRA